MCTASCALTEVQRELSNERAIAVAARKAEMEALAALERVQGELQLRVTEQKAKI